MEGIIGIFEAKNGRPTNFNISQIYHPFLYYYQAKQTEELKDKIKELKCVYLVKQKIKGVTNIKI